ENLESKEVSKKAELESSVCQMEQLGKDLGKDNELLAENNVKLEDAEKECAFLNKDIDEKKGLLIELAHKRANYQNELKGVNEEKTQIKSTIEDAKAKKSSVENELKQLNDTVEDQKANVNSIVKSIEEGETSFMRQEIEHKKLKSDMTALVSSLQLLEETRTKKVSSRELLTALENQLEGLDAGAKTLLQHNGSAYPGILGALADFVDVAPQNLPIIESLLGEKAGYLVVETPAKAQEIAEFAKTNNIGRVGLLWLNGSNGNIKAAKDQKVASELVICQASFEDLINRILGSYIIVNDINEGFKLAENSENGLSFVTQTGDIIDASGKVTVHSNNGHTILSRKAELRRLDVEIDELNIELTDKVSERLRVEEALKDSDEKLKALRHKIYENKVYNLELSKKLEMSLHKHSTLKGELGNINIEISDIVSRAANLDRQEAQINNLLVELKALEENVTKELADYKEKSERYEIARAGLEAERTNIRVAISRKEENIKALGDTIEAANEELDAISSGLQSITCKSENVLSKAVSLTREVEIKTAELEKSKEVIDVLSDKAASITREIDAITDKLDRLKKQEEEISKEITSCKDKLQNITISETETRILLDNLVREAKEELGVDLANEYKDSEEVINTQELDSEILNIRGELERIGNVNMLALDRLNELSERHKVLSEQEGDIIKSKEKLQELIRNLNKESREVFERTLESVKVSFSELFRKLFGGGKADIVLEMSEGNSDILEAGVEIYAKPPKKELTTLSLLSGGEKTLTALALIMALFKVNPSPFCIMDEVDAALDESNVDKFAGLVGEFANTTQFIVITHNKKTMSMADAIYGITMEQPGVSKKVAVSFDDIEKRELVEAVS
ncbi:hypothetical protein HY605_04440, partial [Candidatus Peregrinibacteria bacterium]|nr:hypothetical protein [Candidatus Peregrinibacteria bacterium]